MFLVDQRNCFLNMEIILSPFLFLFCFYSLFYNVILNWLNGVHECELVYGCAWEAHQRRQMWKWDWKGDGEVYMLSERRLWRRDKSLPPHPTTSHMHKVKISHVGCLNSIRQDQLTYLNHPNPCFKEHYSFILPSLPHDALLSQHLSPTKASLSMHRLISGRFIFQWWGWGSGSESLSNYQ